MAKRTSRRRKVKRKATGRHKPARRSVKKASARLRTRTPARSSRTRTKRKPKSPPRRAVVRQTLRAKEPAHARPASLDRKRRILEETVPTPPSSLNMPRRGSSATTGREELAESAALHKTLTPAITAGDVDVSVQDAYFSGDEAPGGDNQTPGQDIVDNIGKALGVQYQDNEELQGSDKVSARDKHRWELDPASSEDYRNRK